MCACANGERTKWTKPIPCRLTSSKKTPSPWTSRLSSLRGTFCPTNPGFVSSVSTTSGAVCVCVCVSVNVLAPVPGTYPVPQYPLRSLRVGNSPASEALCAAHPFAFRPTRYSLYPVRARYVPGTASRVHRLSGRGLNGPDDVDVARAAADVALDRLANLLLVRGRLGTQQCRCAHQHPRRAVAALERVMVAERLLQRRQLAIG